MKIVLVAFLEVCPINVKIVKDCLSERRHLRSLPAHRGSFFAVSLRTPFRGHDASPQLLKMVVGVGLAGPGIARGVVAEQHPFDGRSPFLREQGRHFDRPGRVGMPCDEQRPASRLRVLEEAQYDL